MSTPLFSSALPSLTAVGLNRRNQQNPVATCKSREDQENDSVRRTRPSPTLRGTTPGTRPNLVAEEQHQYSTPVRRQRVVAVKAVRELDSQFVFFF